MGGQNRHFDLGCVSYLEGNVPIGTGECFVLKVVSFGVCGLQFLITNMYIVVNKLIEIGLVVFSCHLFIQVRLLDSSFTWVRFE